MASICAESGMGYRQLISSLASPPGNVLPRSALSTIPRPLSLGLRPLRAGSAPALYIDVEDVHASTDFVVSGLEVGQCVSVTEVGHRHWRLSVSSTNQPAGQTSTSSPFTLSFRGSGVQAEQRRSQSIRQSGSQ